MIGSLLVAVVESEELRDEQPGREGREEQWHLCCRRNLINGARTGRKEEKLGAHEGDRQRKAVAQGERAADERTAARSCRTAAVVVGRETPQPLCDSRLGEAR